MKKLLNMTERRRPLSAVTQITSQEPPNHVHLMTARASTLNIKQIMIELGNPWSAVVGDETNRDRTGQPVVGRDASHEPGNEQSMLNEVDIDFRIPG